MKFKTNNTFRKLKNDYYKIWQNYAKYKKSSKKIDTEIFYSKYHTGGDAATDDKLFERKTYKRWKFSSNVVSMNQKLSSPDESIS